ncbi:MAG: hypothetical protein FJX54_08410 [Alphaproteobacteria bacterium]|nr:hypothetical protein [Alphaproteobacteria bacterium]
MTVKPRVPMSRAVVKAIEIVGGLVAGLMIAAALLFWRLNQGPIPLDVLTPYLEQALSVDERGVRARIGATRLTWAGWERAVDLRATDVQAVGPDGGVIAALPDIAVRLGLPELARGRIRPVEIEVVKPRLRLTRAADGSIDLGLGEGGEEGHRQSGAMLAGLLNDLSGPRQGDEAMSLPDRVVITGADLAVSDLADGIFWRASDVDLRFERSAEGLRLRIQGDAEIGGRRARIDGAGRYLASAGTIESQFQLSRFEPAALAPFFPDLKRVKLMIDGTVNAVFDAEGRLLSARVEAASGPGAIELPEFYREDLAIAGAQLRVRLDRAADMVEIERAVVDLGGPVARGAARLAGLRGRGLLEADAVLENMEVDQLSHFWPASLAGNARWWVTENISRGVAREARLKLTGEVQDLKNLMVKSVAGGITYENLTVRYLAPMPPVRQVRGTATFTDARFDLAIAGGVLDNLKITQSTVALSGLDKERERAEIEVVVSGPVKDALHLIDSKPLGYTSKIGIGLDGVAGDAAIRLRFAFPLISNLKLEQVALSAAANLRGVAVPKVIRGWDVSDAKGTLSLDGRGMTVKGDGRLQGTPVVFEWREEFDDAPAVRRRFDVRGRADDAARKALDLPFLDKASGPIDAHVIAVQRPNGTSDIDVDLDLAGAKLRFDEIMWRKPAGKAGNARFVLKLERADLVSLEDLRASAEDLDLGGRITFNKETDIQTLELAKLKVGNSDVRVGVRRREGGFNVGVSGERLDLRPLFADDDERGPKKKGPALAVEIQVAELRVSDDRAFASVRASLESDGLVWRRIGAEGRVGVDGRFALDLSAADRLHRFHLTSLDAGAMMRAMGYYDHMVGGRLVLDGTVDIDAKGLPFTGDLMITDFSVVQAPALARLASLASFSGIVETLSGAGIGFSRLSAKLIQTEERITIKESLAAGGSLGVTAHGWVERKTDAAEIEGTAVPAYTLNRVIGAIPLIGTIVTGGQNEGVVAADFRITGPLDRPEVSVNPLSTLAPGILRRIVRVLGDFEGDGARREEQGGNR